MATTNKSDEDMEWYWKVWKYVVMVLNALFTFFVRTVVALWKYVPWLSLGVPIIAMMFHEHGHDFFVKYCTAKGEAERNALAKGSENQCENNWHWIPSTMIAFGWRMCDVAKFSTSAPCTTLRHVNNYSSDYVADLTHYVFGMGLKFVMFLLSHSVFVIGSDVCYQTKQIVLNLTEKDIAKEKKKKAKEKIKSDENVRHITYLALLLFGCFSFGSTCGYLLNSWVVSE